MLYVAKLHAYAVLHACECKDKARLSKNKRFQFLMAFVAEDPAFVPTARGEAREAIVRPPDAPEGCAGGQRRVTPRQACPRPDGFGRNLRSKTRWFTGFCNSHQVSHFATFFIDARAEISVAESRFDIRETSPPPVHPADGATVRRTLRSVFLGACRAGGSLARTSSAFARAGGGGDRTGAFAPRPGPDFICNVFAVCFCRFRQ